MTNPPTGFPLPFSRLHISGKILTGQALDSWWTAMPDADQVAFLQNFRDLLRRQAIKCGATPGQLQDACQGATLPEPARSLFAAKLQELGLIAQS